MIALAAAVGFAVAVTMVKSLTHTEKTVAIIFWMLVIQSLDRIAARRFHVWRNTYER